MPGSEAGPFVKAKTNETSGNRAWHPSRPARYHGVRCRNPSVIFVLRYYLMETAQSGIRSIKTCVCNNLGRGAFETPESLHGRGYGPTSSKNVSRRNGMKARISYWSGWRFSPSWPWRG